MPEVELRPHEQYIVDVLLNCAKGSTPSQDHSKVAAQPSGINPCPPGQKGQPVIVPVLLSTLDAISHLRLVVPKDLRQDAAREHLWKSVLEVQSRFPKGIALLDPIQHMGIKDEKFKELVKVTTFFFPLCLSITEYFN
jgi:ATP-dependent RNA helicase DOB1